MGDMCFSDCNNLAYRISPGRAVGVLNPGVYKTAPGFAPRQCGRGGCMTTTYTTRDARLLDTPRAMQLELDTPPSDGSVWMDDVYDPRNVPSVYTAGGYTSYAEMTPGQIVYYIDPLVAPAFRHQIYTPGARTVVRNEITPMGKVEPLFERVPAPGPLSAYSFSDDQLHFRNDIIARQQRGHNRVRFEAQR